MSQQEQHGGVQQHESIDKLVQKIGDVVDKTALMALEEEVFAMIAARRGILVVRVWVSYAAWGINKTLDFNTI
ncbi:hypothetical protein OPT61_g10027 [Boeremia exigua]|uniref:Uncharacterized protein n=1 Tax=Boeremia exigua TaxID=749465 RepID=A0ACC2HRK1_9PLEO|nr:hypothetical protein OPT61_g10027 [Boeremia exigua]